MSEELNVGKDHEESKKLVVHWHNKWADLRQEFKSKCLSLEEVVKAKVGIIEELRKEQEYLDGELKQAKLKCKLYEGTLEHFASLEEFGETLKKNGQELGASLLAGYRQGSGETYIEIARKARRAL